jgi:hypothetical protein
MLRMLENPGKYLFVTSRVELICEWYDYLTDRRPPQKQLRLVKIHNDPKCKVSVKRRIEDAATEYAEDDHAVVLITHEAMMSMDLSGFAGWHIYIDEAPAATMSDSICAPATAIFLREIYDLVPVDSEWSRVVIKPGAPSQSDILKDNILKGLADFDKRVRSPQGVLVDVKDWNQIVGSTRPLNWISIWTPMQLQAFESVTIAGAGYLHSLGYKAALALHRNNISFEQAVIPSSERARPRFLIHYFTEKHRGSTDFWEKPEGKAAVRQVAHHLETVDIGYWTANKSIAPFFRLSGEYVTPRQEGTNELRHHTSCAMIYSAKATPSDGPLMKFLGLTKREFERARESEDIIQFMFRGAPRRADFNGNYPIWVYGKDQAEAAAQYLRDEDLADYELIPVEEAGIMDLERPKPGPKKQLDERSSAERVAARKEADKLRKRKTRAEQKAAGLTTSTHKSASQPQARI